MTEQTDDLAWRVIVYRDGPFWMIRLPDLLNGLTQATSRADVDRQARDYIATVLDLDDPADLQLDIIDV